MGTILKSHHPARQAKSFKYAASGIFHTLINEPNFRIQVLIVFIAVFLGLHFNISNIEWGLLTLSMGLLLAAELLNTVVEEFIDKLIPDQDDGARIIKDVSAGFVLITALTGLVILFLIFGGRLLSLGSSGI